MYHIRVFISHSWTYPQHYETLAGWIFEESWNSNGIAIVFEDASVPKHDPIHYARNQEQLKTAIYNKITLANVVVIPTGMYASYSD